MATHQPKKVFDDEFPSDEGVVLLRKLDKSIKSNFQCNYNTIYILDQLSQIRAIISEDPNDEDMEKTCDTLLDAGVIATIVKLLDSTKDGPIVHNCFQLVQGLTFFAKKSRHITIEYVSLEFIPFNIDLLVSQYIVMYTTTNIDKIHHLTFRFNFASMS